MQALSAGYSASGRAGLGDVAAVTDVATAASLIGTHVVPAHDRPIVFGDEGLLVGGEPVRQCVSLADVWVDRIC